MNTVYNTLSDSADGKYTVSAACTNGKVEKNFCVDAPGCLSAPSTTVDDGTPPSTTTDDGTPSSTTTDDGVLPSTTTGGGGTSCNPNWSCDEWSFCGPDLTQTRSCFDLNGCQAEKEETQPCEPCQESWVCSLWAECSYSSQTRVCYDEHSCDTTNLKPAIQKGCNEADPFPAPAKISTQLPPPFVPQAPVVQQSFLSKLWGNYSVYLIGGAAAILLAVIILLAIFFLKPKKVAYNINELKQWVRKEKEMGTSDTDIRQILKQNTGWSDEEIEMAFESLKLSSRTVSNISE
ncbi:hypothetical protein HY494_00435 [Candidatus Woesearchaeota archaeon]|nr:hypothetical protein [Candidatus Woesearchaeota archaeon]